MKNQASLCWSVGGGERGRVKWEI